ncbi:hypothetical protein GF358_00410 [Candidatus Woesearchaeota archaeon]|nr:hypothetical protein [Candidatus Woesearchaeota archaeon]
MKYNTTSAMVGKRGKRDEEGNCPIFVHLFNINDPHKTDKVPDKFLEFNNIHKIIIDGLAISYLLAGQDILINDLEYIKVKKDEYDPHHHLIISGKQKS